MLDFQSDNCTREQLANAYRRVRAQSRRLCEPLVVDDYQIQSIVETSPPKWHLAHVSWFFETFLLHAYTKNYQPFHAQFHYLFNSYYYTVGDMQPRPRRGVLSRPTVDEIHAYRQHVDQAILALLNDIDEQHWPEARFRMTLGLNHEQQHQELLLMDIKHNFFQNPLYPVYATRNVQATHDGAKMRWLERPGGEVEIGHTGTSFGFDNESPRHALLIPDHLLATRLINNEDYLAFMDDDGYDKPELWLSDGWAHIHRENWRHPLYWREQQGNWYEFTLHGMHPLQLDAPVVHLSYYEADAYARWAGARLPTEAELECNLAERPAKGNFIQSGALHPLPGEGQWYGDAWEWTQSPYTPYPGFKPLAGGMGEYNGKFMCNQMSLRGGSCVTPSEHIRPSYRNFFYPHDRWPFAGLRLAKDAT